VISVIAYYAKVPCSITTVANPNPKMVSNHLKTGVELTPETSCRPTLNISRIIGPDDGGGKFLRNDGKQDCTTTQSIKPLES
jgi:hypothetical protein